MSFRWLARMARYFFHLENGNKIEDDEGEDCASLEEARNHARQVAFELGAHKPAAQNHSSWVRVTDGDGKEIFRTLLRAKRDPKYDPDF
jgi:hypothetical protein